MESDIVVLLVVLLALLFLGYVTEHGFENLISRPIIERWLKTLKPFQPYIVTAIGIVLIYVSKEVVTNLVPDLAPYLNASGDLGTVLAGVMASVIAMAWHTKTPGIVG